VFAPSGATNQSKLPVFFFIQGGGFNANSNPNLNGSGLIIASDMNIVVVEINYRVGPYGFIAGSEIESANNGLRDQRKALEWVQNYIHLFGGNPDHVVMGGDSAGAASVTLQLTAFRGRDDHLFHGTAAESQSFATVLTVDESQYQYDNFVIRTGCVGASDTLSCLRSKTAEELQAVNFNTPYPGAQAPPLYMWNPVIDNDFIQSLTYTAFASGAFVKVPAIFGDDNNGGTIFTPRNTSNYAESDWFLQNQFPYLTLPQLATINSLYPEVGPTYPMTGPFYRQVSNAYGEMRYLCPGLFCSSAFANASLPSWNYRYNVEDPTQIAEGLGVPHTVELNAIWGPEYVGGGAPASYNTTNAGVVPVIQGYWTSFIRALDPNTYRAEGTPRWEEWTSGGMERLLFNTSGPVMETVDMGQRGRCAYLSGIGVSVRQ
jgi:carboxylesterase type B